ncbi:hypothetical protein [Streptomyces sp. NPDC047097]|uniref:hypothetical protein n=1 Tax=Streptomyces sp. NPDC047097 TaxID=3155260 RepID=UPI0033CA0392
MTTVLPLVEPAGWLERRSGRPAWRWTPTLAAVPALLLPGASLLLGGTSAVGAAWTWLVSTAALAVPALAVRPVALRPVPIRTGKAFGLTAVGGLLVPAAVGGAIAAAFGTGLLTEYEPPRLSREQAVGVWTDGDGGTLRLESDGTATARDVEHEGSAPDRVGTCSGTGTGTYTEGDSP